MPFAGIRHRPSPRREDAGTSLVEMVVTIAVLSIVMSMIFGIVINVVNSSNQFRDRTQEQADSRLAIDTLVRDLRQAYSGNATLPSVEPTSSATKIVFYSPDRAEDFHLRKITYELTGGTLTRTVSLSNERVSQVVGTGWSFPAATPVAVLPGVLNTTLFTYRTTKNQVWPAYKPLAAVQLDLVIDQTPDSSPTRQTYHTEVALRVIQ